MAMCSLDFSHTKISVGRSVWSYSKVRHFVGALIRGRKRFMSLKTEGLILDIGCGPNGNSKNINLDYAWRPGIDICCDITRGLPLPNNYVAGIFSEHCIEHISPQHALGVFREMHRILSPGGHIRIVIPDLEIYITKYQAKQPMPYAGNDSINGIYTPAMSINRIMREHEHRFIYDYETLHAMLTTCGFFEINKRKFNDSADRALLLDTPERAIESLYVEASKRYVHDV
jgi:predicted SAM-dependent methyltransferase